VSTLSNADVIDAALETFRERRLEEAEIYLEDVALESVAVSGGKVEGVENKIERGAGVRVLQGGRLGFAYTADLSPDGIGAMVKRATTASAHTDARSWRVLPQAETAAELEGNEDPDGEAWGPAEKIALAVAIEEAARAHDARVAQVRESRYQDVRGSITVGRAGGYRYGFSFTRAFGFVDLVARDGGESQSGFQAAFAIGPSGLDPGAIGRAAAARAVHKLGGRPCETRRTSVLLAPEVVDGLLETLAPAFFGESVLKGKSLLADAVGKQVAGKRVNLVDDGRLAGGYSSAPVDGEGVATRRTVLLEEGVLQGFLHDGFSAARMGAEPTGNAERDSYLCTPTTGTTGLILEPTGESRGELLAAVPDGLLIEEVMGLHTINPITGDFSLGALGRSVRAGTLGEPVAGVAIAGNVRRLLEAITAVADDVRLMPSGNAVSTVLLEDLAVGGE
jgi:PmbA protein